MYIYHIYVHIPYICTCTYIICTCTYTIYHVHVYCVSFSENSKKEIDIITIPDGSLTLVHEPKTKVDLTKYLEHHRFK